MKIISTKFVRSSADPEKCPAAIFPEYAFSGRSNVGKSSLINMVAGLNKLAKTSSTPGKTRLINHFLINEKWYLADLPGYGFAKVSKTEKAKWEKNLSEYLLGRKNLMCLFVLIDSRLKPQASDLGFIDWCGHHKIPFVILFTKTDKLSKNEWRKNIKTFEEALKPEWEQLPHMIPTSSVKKEGRDEILELIEETNKLFEKKY